MLSMGMSAMMATMRKRMLRKKHWKPMIDQRTMWRAHLATRNVDVYEFEDGHDANTDE